MMSGARRHKFTALAVLLGGVVLAQTGAVRAEGPFPRLAGSWSGYGQVVLDQGKSEQISCRAYYTPKSAGADLALAIRCASSSYKIEMRATLSQQNGQVTGQWEERTFNAAGSVSGRATDSSLNLAISGAVSGSAWREADRLTLGSALVLHTRG